MSACCQIDCDPAEVWRESFFVARKRHKCTECGRAIPAGARYQRIFYVQEGCAMTARTCARCLALIDFVRASVPCFMEFRVIEMVHEAAIECAREYRREAPGLLFGAWRRISQARRQEAFAS